MGIVAPNLMAVCFQQTRHSWGEKSKVRSSSGNLWEPFLKEIEMLCPHHPDPSAVKSQSTLYTALEMLEHAHHAQIDLNRTLGGKCVCSPEKCVCLSCCPEEHWALQDQISRPALRTQEKR